MHPAIPQLIELQQLDQRIAALRSELETYPKRIVEADKKLNGARAGLVAAKEAHTQKLTARKKAELDAQDWADRAKKFRAQSSAVKTNEAYKALQHEIANAEAEISKAEDAQLEIMMALEGADRDVKAAEAVLREAEAGVAAERKEIESTGRAKKREMDADIASREKLASQIPDELMTRYARAAKRHHGVGIAEAMGEQCRGCGMRVLPHTVQELRRAGNHEIYTCETCGRVLYAVEPAPAANSDPASSTAGAHSA